MNGHSGQSLVHKATAPRETQNRFLLSICPSVGNARAGENIRHGEYLPNVVAVNAISCPVQHLHGQSLEIAASAGLGMMAVICVE